MLQTLLLNAARDQLTALVGQPREDSRPGDDALARTGGWMDTYLTPSQISTLLTLAAHQQLSVRREGEWAMLLFQLAGRHSEVLEELCNKLSDAMATAPGPGSEAEYWKKTSVEYYDRYIKSGDSSVSRCLEVDNRVDLVGTFETLLNLAVFLEAAAAGRYREALQIIDALGLYPQVADEVSPAAHQFSSLDGYIRRVADETLLATVECAKALFVQLRAETTGGTPGMARGVVTEREGEKARLKERVNALVMFAGIVRSRLNKPNTAIVMARIEDTMS